MRQATFNRYDNDPEFATLVNMLYNILANCDVTPNDLREAAVLAAMKQEMMSTRSIILTNDEYERLDPSLRAKMEGRHENKQAMEEF